MNRITQEDLKSLQELDDFACNHALSWNLKGGDNSEMNFWLELQGSGDGEYFRAKKCHSITSAVEGVMEKANKFFKEP